MSSAARRAVAELCATSGISVASCDALAACWRAYVGGTAAEAPGAVGACLEAAAAPSELASITARTDELAAQAAARRTVEWSGTVRIAGLGPGTYDLERTLLDRTHGNACAHNRQTEPTGEVTVVDGRVDLPVTLVADGVELLRLRARGCRRTAAGADGAWALGADGSCPCETSERLCKKR